MNFKTLSKVLNTSFSNVQNLANVLRDAFSNMEGGGSSGSEYSTTERVVGTWMGKPLYQRTFTFSFTCTSNGSRCS